ncbi:methyltransferase domain-containing protein [Actinoplanes subtropicus]|uniref:methyltransferase domain-containing protein n=1 Tax=Actinoplanes subtropicus TaxID=543632 RepID=UPI0004C35BDB|nr:methyltransferase domain-containing protein [Actinoplanes subtropicus]
MNRAPLQNDLLIQGLTKRFAKQKPVMDFMEEHLTGPRVCDLGCGNGIPLRYLAERHPDRMFVGVDHSTDILGRNLAADRDNVLLVKGSLEEPLFAPGTMDTAIFNRSLHEVYSLTGEDGVKRALAAAADALRPGGRVLVYENVIASRRMVRMRFTDPEVSAVFDRFLGDYSIRPITFSRETDDTIVIREDDALEFLTKYRDPDWESEMREAHFIYTRQEWDGVVSSCGLRPYAIRSFDDRQILVTDGVQLGWEIADFKHVLVYELPR